MLIKEVRALNTKELEHKIDESYKELFNLRFQWESGQLEEYTRVKLLKKDIARLLTIQHERELAAALIREEGTDA